jgi:hypothetical protein
MAKVKAALIVDFDDPLRTPYTRPSGSMGSGQASHRAHLLWSSRSRPTVALAKAPLSR